MCPECKGKGVQKFSPDSHWERTCHHCDGKGAVPAEVDPWPDNALEGGCLDMSVKGASDE
jgi:RecJ-like exonuclease